MSTATFLETVRPESPWRRAWLTGLATWALAYVSYLILVTLSWTAVQSRPAPRLTAFFDVWSRWDTEHYLYIAAHGYDARTENPAFFPLYPLLIRITDPVLPGHTLGAALVVSSVACIAALAVIHRLVEDLFTIRTAQRATLYLMASPFAFYLVVAYNESLLLALCTASLYAMRRGHWWTAGALAGLASATRQAGVLLAFAFAVEYLRQHDWRVRRWPDVRSIAAGASERGADARRRTEGIGWDALAVVLVPSGLIAFMIYSAAVMDDPLMFLHVQRYWGRELSWPWEGTVTALAQLGSWSATTPLNSWAVLSVIDIVTLPLVLGLLVLAVVGPWRLGPESWYLVTFGAAVLLMVVLSPLGRTLPALHGLPRYALEVVPAFVVLARMGADRFADRAYLFPAIVLQSALLLAFSAGVWLS